MARPTDDLLADLLALCVEADDHLRGVDPGDFLDSKVLQRATERTLELIGDCANQLGSARPKIDVPWEKVLGMRIVLAYAYHKVQPIVVYETAVREIPRLRRALEALKGAKPKK